LAAFTMQSPSKSTIDPRATHTVVFRNNPKTSTDRRPSISTGDDITGTGTTPVGNENGHVGDPEHDFNCGTKGDS